jgi:hypothetical protein
MKSLVFVRWHLTKAPYFSAPAGIAFLLVTLVHADLIRTPGAQFDCEINTLTPFTQNLAPPCSITNGGLIDITGGERT